jgi:hypothetical protein
MSIFSNTTFNMNRSGLRFSVVMTMLWVSVLSVLYFFFVDLSMLPSSVSTPTHTRDLVDAVVFIAAGKMAQDPMVDLSVQSLRRVGQWEGDIYVLTDRPSCFSVAVERFNVKPVAISSELTSTIVHIKTLKATLFDFLPMEITNIIYMDVDIVVAKKLSAFLTDLNTQLVDFAKHKKRGSTSSNDNEAVSQQNIALRDTGSGSGAMVSLSNENAPDFAMFLDAGGHFAGSWVSGVERWHTGVMWARRGSGTQCLSKWAELLMSGKYQSDQEAIDEAERQGSCPNAMVLSFRHLLFAKDYLMILFRGGQTYIHFTAAGRKEDRDAFYSNMVMPTLRGSIRPKLDLSELGQSKDCNAKEHPLMGH